MTIYNLVMSAGVVVVALVIIKGWRSYFQIKPTERGDEFADWT